MSLTLRRCDDVWPLQDHVRAGGASVGRSVAVDGRGVVVTGERIQQRSGAVRVDEMASTKRALAMTTGDVGSYTIAANGHGTYGDEGCGNAY